MKSRIAIALIVVIMVAGCVHQPILVTGKSKNFGVSLEAKVQPNKEWVKVLSKAQGFRKSGKKDGYVGYAPGESGVTLFSVKKEDLNANCAGTAEWVITKLELASEGDPADEKGSNFGSAQPAWLAEAFPGVNLANGELFAVGKNDGQTFLPVYNANGQEGFQLVYYRVTLTRCSDGKSVPTDPVWGNGGRTKG
ncbi:MAG: hypothetical protein HKO85_07840 [Xanthomonadales bacterium]|nr:hypothetical protein [Gammaproteobacteria bacterium]MBT8050236.1 hypothetical protein [Gammaproteobacteria bacterium]MBT8056613.1 hypothetical protein [Gammaproteobacteria bacterium]NNJ79449.1 hypothetical protein [Xanthomonadales bacterium]NNL05187.1 hypothetical protein [Xanthomonadales bacterium]